MEACFDFTLRAVAKASKVEFVSLDLRGEGPVERQNGGALATVPGRGNPAPLWFSRPVSVGVVSRSRDSDRAPPPETNPPNWGGGPRLGRQRLTDSRTTTFPKTNLERRPSNRSHEGIVDRG
jgi:hypothetical protein